VLDREFQEEVIMGEMFGVGGTEGYELHLQSLEIIRPLGLMISVRKRV
jgi:hypothetical protein